jgi:thioesterase domain-containing protein/acyl carrier protein
MYRMPAAATESSSTRVTRSAADIRAWLVAELARSMKIAPSQIDTAQSLFSLGVDSLIAVGMTGALADWLNRDLPASLMWDYASIDAMAEGLADRAAPATEPVWPGVVTMNPAGQPQGQPLEQPHGDHSPIFFFPGAKGHPVTFFALAAQLGPAQPCYGLTIPGFDGETKLLMRVEEIAAKMLERIRLVQPKGPYQFAGYSFGGLLAYEAAQQLTASGETVSMLATYDTFTPAGRTVRPLWQRLALHAFLIFRYPDRLPYLIRRFNQLRADRRVKRALRENASKGIADPAAVLLENIEYANAQAGMHYQPRIYSGSMLLFRASVFELHNIFYKIDAYNGWWDLTGGRVRRIDLPGTHLDILSAENAPVAAQMLQPHLWAAEPLDPGSNNGRDAGA